METLCSRQDFLGRVSRHYLSTSPVSEQRWRSPALRQMRRRVQQPRLSLRALASYRTLLTLLLLYLLFALFSFSLLSSTALILIISLLYELLLLLLTDKLKTHWHEWRLYIYENTHSAILNSDLNMWVVWDWTLTVWYLAQAFKFYSNSVYNVHIVPFIPNVSSQLGTCLSCLRFAYLE